MQEKIRKWEEEILRITEKKEVMIRKYNEDIRSLRKKIEEAEQQLVLENNQMIAETVRAIYGEVTRENLEAFKRLMASMAGQTKEAPETEDGEAFAASSGNGQR